MEGIRRRTRICGHDYAVLVAGGQEGARLSRIPLTKRGACGMISVIWTICSLPPWAIR